MTGLMGDAAMRVKPGRPTTGHSSSAVNTRHCGMALDSHAVQQKEGLHAMVNGQILDPSQKDEAEG